MILGIDRAGEYLQNCRMRTFDFVVMGPHKLVIHIARRLRPSE
jgi:hypothetical protein